MSEETESYITIEQAAKQVGMSETELRKQIREGRLPALRSSEDETLVRPEDLQKLMTLMQGDEALEQE